MRLPSARLRAISPIIAMIVIISITLAIAFAVVGWLFGIWGGIAGGTPQISITNVKVYESGGNGVIELYIVNRGAGSDKILKVELIKGNDVASQTSVAGTSGEGFTTADGILTIQANARGWVTYNVSLPKGYTLNVGDSVLVKAYLENSGIYSIPVIVSPG